MVQSMEKTLSAEINESDPTTFLGNISLKKGGDIFIEGAWSGSLSIQVYFETSDTWKTILPKITENCAKAIDAISPGTYRVGFQTGDYASGECVVALRSSRDF